MVLGGPKYAEFELEPSPEFGVVGRNLLYTDAPLEAGFRSGQTGAAVNPLATAFAGSNPAPATHKHDGYGQAP